MVCCRKIQEETKKVMHRTLVTVMLCTQHTLRIYQPTVAPCCLAIQVESIAYKLNKSITQRRMVCVCMLLCMHLCV